MENNIVLPDPSQPLGLALNTALGSFRAAAARQMFGRSNGMDAKRLNAWEAFGWNPDPGFDDFYRLWERGGLAHGAIARVISKSWQDNPEINEGDQDEEDRERTDWERMFARFAEDFGFWGVFQEADLRRCVGNYSAIILQIADSKTWDSPVTGRGVRRLVKMIPAWQGQIQPTEYDMDETSATYGEPTMYSFNEGAVGLANSTAAASFAGRIVNIHPDRVIILGDITHGIPLLRAGYNDFANLEKILGGSGESFLKNAARQLAIEFDKEVDLEDIAVAHGVAVKDLRKIYDEVTAGLNQGIDQTVVTQAAKVNPLVANVPDPEKHFEASCMSAAASLMMPLMIWIGSQTGERASTQDQLDWANTMQSRRTRKLGPEVRKAIARLISLRLLDAPEEFTVAWSNLAEASLAEKLANGKLMSEINAGSLASGEAVYTNEEIRTVTGHTNGKGRRKALPDVDEED